MTDEEFWDKFANDPEFRRKHIARTRAKHKESNRLSRYVFFTAILMILSSAALGVTSLVYGVAPVTLVIVFVCVSTAFFICMIKQEKAYQHEIAVDPLDIEDEDG